MSTGQLTPAQIRIRDKVAHLTPEERQRVLAATGTLAPKNNMEAPMNKSETTSEPLSRERLEASATRLITDMLLSTGGKMPSEEAVKITAKILANKAMREGNLEDKLANGDADGPPTNQTTAPVSNRLTNSEIERLRQNKKESADYFQKAFQKK